MFGVPVNHLKLALSTCLLSFSVLIVSCDKQQDKSEAVSSSRLKITDKTSGLCERSIASNTLNPETLEIYESSSSESYFYSSSLRDANRTAVGAPTIQESLDQTRDMISKMNRGVQFSQNRADEAKRVADIVEKVDKTTTKIFDKINNQNTQFVSVRIKYNDASGAHITRRVMCAVVTNQCNCLPDQKI